MSKAKSAVSRELLSVYKSALLLAFLTLFGLVAIYGIGYMQGNTSKAESLVEPAATYFILFCVISVVCRLGSGMVDAWKRDK